MPERFQKTILQITENDKNRLIYEIENGENFDKRKVRCVFLCYEYPEELVSNKSYYVNYKFNDNSIYVKWIHNIDLFFLKKDAKTFRIKLEEKDKWTDSTNVQIEDYLKKIRQLKSGAFGFPIPLSVLNNETKINNISKGILLTQIKKNLQEYSDIFYNH